MGNMRTMPDVRIVAMEHKNHSVGSGGGGVSICAHFEAFPFVVDNCKVHEV